MKRHQKMKTADPSGCEPESAAIRRASGDDAAVLACLRGIGGQRFVGVEIAFDLKSQSAARAGDFLPGEWQV
jgi:hypothetical protein